MAQTIKLKRSSVSGNTPATSDLELGEVAINTYDGKMYIKKNDGSDSIVEIGGTSGTVTEAFKTIAVSGQSNVVADSATDTLTLVAGSNMTLTTNASGDTFDILPIPANSLVLAAGFDIMTVGTGSGTVALGDSVDADQYVAAVNLQAAGQKVTLDANYAYSSADAIRATIATAAVNGIIRVWACVISLDDGATLSDSDTQTSTYS